MVSPVPGWGLLMSGDAVRGGIGGTDVKRAADVLGVDVATLFLGLPHLDSNQKPAG